MLVGITNALNVVADSMVEIPGASLMAPVKEEDAPKKVLAIYSEIREFYEREDIPEIFAVLARDAAYLKEFWAAFRHAFADNRLTRRLKEALAFAVSVTSGSKFGAAFHVAELRRLGVSDAGVLEVLGVTQMFSSYTKIADTLQLDPDMGDIAPVDWSPAPGGEPTNAEGE